MRRKKRLDDHKNKRLDEFLTTLQIEADKKDKIIKYVEELTFQTIKDKTNPPPTQKLRLK